MKRWMLFFMLILAGCQPATRQNTIQISLVDNDKHLKISGLDNAIMQEINRDTTTNIWQNLIQVYRMPADTGMKDFQPIQPGKYIVKDSTLIFSPDTPFAQHQIYFARYYQYDKGSTAWDYIGHNQKPGKKQYTDIIFKPQTL